MVPSDPQTDQVTDIDDHSHNHAQPMRPSNSQPQHREA
jgi:hypothetical protein